METPKKLAAVAEKGRKAPKDSNLATWTQ